MIFKEKDSIGCQLQGLESRLAQASSTYARRKLEKDLALVRAGLKGEQEATYHINFHLKNHANWAVIHDLRLEWNGRVAQIDHLLLDRLMEVYVVESKSYSTKIRYANGGWERLNNYAHWDGIASPVEQNARHISVLEDLIRDNKLAPTRLSLSLTPKYMNAVLVQPTCSIVGTHPDCALIYRMDAFVKKIRGTDPSATDLVRVIGRETLYQFARALMTFHTPKKETPTEAPKLKSTTTPELICQNCTGPLSRPEASYCHDHSRRFGGKLLCRKCQGYAPKAPPMLRRNQAAKIKAVNIGLSVTQTARCASCSVPVEPRVLSFCRDNWERFNNRILCRLCQPTKQIAKPPRTL
jgi:hypothetical protein